MAKKKELVKCLDLKLNRTVHVVVDFDSVAVGDDFIHPRQNRALKVLHRYSDDVVEFETVDHTQGALRLDCE